jgi:hypothetical protein
MCQKDADTSFLLGEEMLTAQTGWSPTTFPGSMLGVAVAAWATTRAKELAVMRNSSTLRTTTTGAMTKQYVGQPPKGLKVRRGGCRGEPTEVSAHDPHHSQCQAEPSASPESLSHVPCRSLPEICQLALQLPIFDALCAPQRFLFQQWQTTRLRLCAPLSVYGLKARRQTISPCARCDAVGRCERTLGMGGDWFRAFEAGKLVCLVIWIAR